MAFWHGPDALILPSCQNTLPIGLLQYSVNCGSRFYVKQRCNAACRVWPCTLPSHSQASKLPQPPPYAIKTLGSFPRRSRVRANARGGGKGGNEGNGGAGRVVWNLALAGGLTYLTITGRLGWVFDAFVSLWLLAILVPIVGVVAFLWFAERETIVDNCPNCGNEFQVLKFTLTDESQLCPYCSQPFRINEEQFVRDVPHFSSQGAKSFKKAFQGFKQDKSNSNPETPGVIVDVEAEVFDKDEVGR